MATLKAYELKYISGGDGWGEGSGYCLIRTRDGQEICWDGGEPEDRTLTRDFAGLVDELNRVAEKYEKLRRETCRGCHGRGLTDLGEPCLLCSTDPD